MNHQGRDSDHLFKKICCVIISKLMINLELWLLFIDVVNKKELVIVKIIVWKTNKNCGTFSIKRLSCIIQHLWHISNSKLNNSPTPIKRIFGILGPSYRSAGPMWPSVCLLGKMGPIMAQNGVGYFFAPKNIIIIIEYFFLGPYLAQNLHLKQIRPKFLNG